MEIQQIRNAMLKINYGNYTFLTDPWLQDKGAGSAIPAIRKEMANIKSPMDDLPFSPEEILEGVDFCLVTHTHGDHFTKDYLPLNMRFFVQNKKDAEKLMNMGFKNAIEIPENGLKMTSLTIQKTPAIHGENEEVAKLMGNVCGYLINGENKTLYIAGDTVFYEGVANVLIDKKPDIVILNCCEATLPIGRLIMNLDDIKEVYNLTSNSKVIASHLGSVNHALLCRDDILRFAKEEEMDRLLVPESGEKLIF